MDKLFCKYPPSRLFIAQIRASSVQDTLQPPWRRQWMLFKRISLPQLTQSQNSQKSMAWCPYCTPHVSGHKIEEWHRNGCQPKSLRNYQITWRNFVVALMISRLFESKKK